MHKSIDRQSQMEIVDMRGERSARRVPEGALAPTAGPRSEPPMVDATFLCV